VSADSVTNAHGNAPVRGTQLLVEHMGDVFGRPSLVAIEIAWRWLFGIPFLLVCWQQGQGILNAFPLESSGAGSLDTRNPWVAAVQLSNIAAFYEPHVFGVLRWLLPASALVWVIVSGVGRNLLLMHMETRVAFRPVAMILLQAAWLALFCLAVWGWLCSMQWAAATHITASAEPDLVGYFIWAIFLGLGFFTVFALTSWVLTIAPILVLLETHSMVSGLGLAFRLGRGFSSKLAEINLVLGIVKLALLVVAMVFSAAPLPFSDELGPDAMHLVAAASTLFFLVANDFFQVVRLKAFVEFWRIFRGNAAA
jgi:hypothetical protein